MTRSAQKLHHDILRQIFIDAYDLQRLDSSSLARYLHRVHSVCRSWRAVVADASELWTCIVVSEPVFTPDFLSRCLNYSKERPLDLIFRFPDSKSLVVALTVLLPLLLPYRERWRSFSIRPLALTSDVDASPCPPVIGEVPNLQYCTIEVNRVGGDGGAVHLMDLRGPSVEYLTATQDAWLLLALPLRFPHVHSLKLQLAYTYEEEGIGLRSMLRCFAACTFLSRLIVSNQPMQLWDDRPIRIQLPALTELVFDRQLLQDMVSPFLDAIAAPNLRTLLIRECIHSAGP